MANDETKRTDQISMLEACAHFTDHGEWRGMFSYPACGRDLVRLGLADEEGKITTAGRAALFLLDKGADPTPDSPSAVTFTLPMRQPS